MDTPAREQEKTTVDGFKSVMKTASSAVSVTVSALPLTCRRCPRGVRTVRRRVRYGDGW